MLNRIAAILALLIGVMAIFAGGRVLLGILPDYYVIDWLPVYNFAIGVLSVVVGSIAIWKQHRLALPIVLLTLATHVGVMLILQTAYRPVVAPDSIVAMTIRIVVWTIILGLLLWQRRRVAV